mmetsp:Transcript_32313/g.82085  ORF Transcript_32313/g.82085 Transcript_32313/m.82085 type:complete len:225 (-) Transcript_32313:2784-3458(-)
MTCAASDRNSDPTRPSAPPPCPPTNRRPSSLCAGDTARGESMSGNSSPLTTFCLSPAVSPASLARATACSSASAAAAAARALASSSALRCGLACAGNLAICWWPVIISRAASVMHSSSGSFPSTFLMSVRDARPSSASMVDSWFIKQARCSGVLPSLLRAVRLAPALTSATHAALRPLYAARCRGVHAEEFMHSTGAPALRSSSMHSTCPLVAAQCMGWSPSVS